MRSVCIRKISNKHTGIQYLYCFIFRWNPNALGTVMKLLVTVPNELAIGSLWVIFPAFVLYPSVELFVPFFSRLALQPAVSFLSQKTLPTVPLLSAAGHSQRNWTDLRAFTSTSSAILIQAICCQTVQRQKMCRNSWDTLTWAPPWMCMPMPQGRQSGLPQGSWIRWQATIRYIQKKLSLVNCP